MPLMRSLFHGFLGLSWLALPAFFCACGGGGTATSAAGSGAGTGTGGSGGATSSSTVSMSTSESSAGGAGGGTGGLGGTGGSAPSGTPFAYVGAEDGKIRVFTLDKEAGSLAPVQEVDGGKNPSFLAFAPNKKTLYAVNEGSDQIASFAIDGATGQLTLLNRVSSNGGGPAHVAVDATGKLVFGVNYGGGNLTMIATAADGSLGATAATLATGANAHQLVLDGSNQFAFVPNKGSDTVSQLVLDTAAGSLVFNAKPSAPLPGGSGPRHMAFHPSAPYAYVIHENDDKITAFPYDAQNGTLGTSVQTVSTLPEGIGGDNNTCAEIAFGASGKYLYGSNRGHDSIVIFAVDAASGALTLVGHQPTGGQMPRHFSIEASGEVLLVGNQQSNEVVTFRIDPSAGTLTELATAPLPAGPGFVGVIYL
jgi:6-phosphogluconolactonase